MYSYVVCIVLLVFVMLDYLICVKIGLALLARLHCIFLLKIEPVCWPGAIPLKKFFTRFFSVIRDIIT